MRNHCSSHCRACGRHFSSTAAFDAHRRGGRCAEPADVSTRSGAPVFAVKDMAGVCEVAGGEPMVGVVWTLARSQGGADRFSGLREAA